MPKIYKLIRKKYVRKCVHLSFKSPTSKLSSEDQLKTEEELWKFIEREVTSKVEKANSNFLEVIEKMQAQIDQFETDLDDADDALHQRENELHNEKAISSDFKERLLILEHDYNLLLSDFESLTARQRDTEDQLTQLKIRSAETEKSLRARINNESTESDRRIRELLDQCSELSRERDGLLTKYNDVLSSHTMTEEIQSLQKTQMNDLMDRFSQASAENDRIKRKIELLMEDKKMMSQLLEERSRELADLHENQAIELKKLQAQHANAIKQLENELSHHTRLTNAGPNDLEAQLRNQTATGMSPLNIEEMDHRGSALMNPALLALMRGTLRNSNIVIPKSNRNIGDMFANQNAYVPPKLETVHEDLQYLVALLGANNTKRRGNNKATRDYTGFASQACRCGQLSRRQKER